MIRQGEVIDIRGPIRDTLQVRQVLGALLSTLDQPTTVVVCVEADLGVPEEGLDGEMGVVELFHCLLETGAVEGSGLGPREQLGW